VDFSGRKWLSVAQAADHYFSISRKTLYSLISRGMLPEGSVIRLGRQIRINVSAVEVGSIEKYRK